MLSQEIVHKFVYISYKDMYTFLVPKRCCETIKITQCENVRDIYAISGV